MRALHATPSSQLSFSYLSSDSMLHVAHLHCCSHTELAPVQCQWAPRRSNENNSGCNKPQERGKPHSKREIEVIWGTVQDLDLKKKSFQQVDLSNSPFPLKDRTASCSNCAFSIWKHHNENLPLFNRQKHQYTTANLTKKPWKDQKSSRNYILEEYNF